ncbi:hypothetical protein TK35_14110 [Lacticaseibacillus paracasei]|nr:hypothetical protein TK35_14110 [Lacticaseibacillus paracasei]TEA85922.1 hypothetical protein TK36_14235 [Lacticaseibacillus paracasei]
MVSIRRQPMYWLQKRKIKQAIKSNLTGQALFEHLQQVTKDSDPLVIGDTAILTGFTPFGYIVFADLVTGETTIAFKTSLKRD